MQNKEKDDLARVDSQPLTETAELPHRPTEDVPSTAPESDDEEWTAADEEYFRSGTRYPGQ